MKKPNECAQIQTNMQLKFISLRELVLQRRNISVLSIVSDNQDTNAYFNIVYFNPYLKLAYFYYELSGT